MRFRLKMTLCMLGLLAVLFGIGGSLLLSASFHDLLEQEWSAASSSYQVVLGTLQIVNSVSQTLEYDDIVRTLEQLSSQKATFWVAMRLCAAERTIYEEGPFPTPLPEPVRDTGQCTLRYAAADDAHILTATGAFEASGTLFTLEIAYDVSQPFAARAVQERVYHGVFLGMAALCAVLAYSASFLLTRSLRELSRASNAIRAGDLSRRAEIRSADEIGQVAQDFNRMAESLERNIAELTEAMARQERFIGSFAHETKTPLTSMIGYADLIRSDVLSADERGQAANFIVTEGRRLELLSQKLLELLVVRQGTCPLLPASPAAIIRSLCASLAPLSEKQGITLTCSCEDGECRMESDLVRSLLLNLWDNARKAMVGRGGHIAIHSVMLPDGCRIRVQDDGKGIPPQSLARLTEAFYRVDKARSRAQGGAGLGLALCQQIARLHHGSIQFESELGRGTTVIVELRGGAV